MATTVASMQAVLSLDKQGFERDINNAGKSLTGFGSTLQGIISVAGGNLLSGAISGVGKAISSGFGAMNDALKESIQLAGIQQDAEAQLEQRIRSTGGAAGYTAEQMKNMASRLQSVTTFGDEAIIGAEALLATFTNIDVNFGLATRTILDMSVAMGQDLKSSTIQVGKALNDPIAGVGALSRVGVQFTEVQKEMITTMVEGGDVMGAQALILRELQTQFGGAAAAAADTFNGRMAQMFNLFGDAKEQIGDIFLPLLKRFAEEVIPLVTKAIDYFQKNMKDKLLGVMGGLQYILTNVVIPALKDFGAWFATKGYVLFDAFLKVINFTVIPGLLALARWFVEVGKNALGWISTLVQVFQQNGLEGAMKFIMATLNTGWNDVVKVLGNWASKFWDWVTGGQGVLARAPEALNKILDKTQEWIDATRGRLVLLGEKIGTILADGLKKVMDNKEKIGAVVGAAIVSIAAGVAKSQNQINQIGEAIAEGLIEGFARKFGINTAIAKGAVKGLLSGINPVAGFAGNVQGFAQGGSFTVPKGYPNDSYLMGVTSGEQVTVVPKNVTQNITQNNNYANGESNGLSYYQLRSLAT